MEKETICAISTPIGAGGISIIRLSGKDAIKIANKVLEKKINEIRYATLNKVVANDFTDTVISIYFKAPNSFTGEDIVEIQCHGGILLTQKILELLIENGAKLAENGEFTKRAFLNGKLTLDKAEGIIDLINAESEAALTSASSLLKGDLTKNIHEKQKVLTDILAELEVILDYPEHDVEYQTINGFIEKITALKNSITNLINTSSTGMIIKNGINVVILGTPNVGKSSIMNALLNFNRAIVTNIAGTTRDTITESYNYKGIKVNLIDTAGIRENTDSIVEKIGVDLAIESINKADLILFVLDSTRNLTEEEKLLLNNIQNKKVIIALNKQDLKDANFSFNSNFKTIKVSALNKTNIDELKELIYTTVLNENVLFNQTIITNARHKTALINCETNLADALNTLNSTGALDLFSIDLYNAYSSLGEITGEANKENIIDAIFSKFCLGK